jgi:biotin-[acetyl-CoA-carboxylase] ligase BirA-like protein
MPTLHAEHHDVVTSTQEVAHGWLDTLAAVDRVGVFSADHQTDGLGRGGRSWVDVPGSGVLMSVAVPGGVLRHVQLDDLAPRVARAVAGCLERQAGVAAEWRAPNDVYVDGRKLGGVLVDARTVGAELERLVIGIGVNVRGEQFEVEGRAATTIEAEGGTVTDPALLRAALALAALRAVRG